MVWLIFFLSENRVSFKWAWYELDFGHIVDNNANRMLLRRFLTTNEANFVVLGIAFFLFKKWIFRVIRQITVLLFWWGYVKSIQKFVITFFFHIFFCHKHHLFLKCVFCYLTELWEWSGWKYLGVGSTGFVTRLISTKPFMLLFIIICY